jgi:hypothetical protein
MALAPWSRALGAEPQVKDLIVFLPGILGSVLQKNNKDVWAFTAESIGGALSTLGRNVDGLEIKDDPQDVDDLGDGVAATACFRMCTSFPASGRSTATAACGMRSAGD